MKTFKTFEKSFYDYKNNLQLISIKEKKKRKYWHRSLKFQDYMVNTVIDIYNGLNFFEILVTNNMMKYKLGDFSFTRKKVEFLKRRKKK